MVQLLKVERDQEKINATNLRDLSFDFIQDNASWHRLIYTVDPPSGKRIWWWLYSDINITSKLVVNSDNFVLRTEKACESISRESLSRTFEAPHLACLTAASRKHKP